MNDDNTFDTAQAVMNAMYPMALPQKVEPITKKTFTTQRTQYDPNKLSAVMAALKTPRSTKPLLEALNAPRNSEIGTAESIARALATMPEQRSFTGAYGTEVINPWTALLGSGMRAYGTAYGDRASAKREADNLAREDAIKAAQIQVDAENAAREDAIKAAQLDLEANKEQITSQIADDYIKYNLDPNAKTEAAAQAAAQKLAQTAYVKLDPDLPQKFRDNPKSFGYAAREADIGARTQGGGTTGMTERIVASVMKDRVGDNALKKRAELLQAGTQYVSAITDMAKQGGATGAMMNSDKEGQRAMSMFANPGAYTAEELGAAADTLIDLYDRMLAVQGMPSVREGYEMVTRMVEAQKPQTQQTQTTNNAWDKYKTK